MSLMPSCHKGGSQDKISAENMSLKTYYSKIDNIFPNFK